MDQQIKRILARAAGSMLVGAVIVMGVPSPLAFAGELPAAHLPKGEKVNVNTATEDELAEVPTLDRSDAKKIIAARPYKTASDLGKAGLDEKRIALIKPHILFEKVNLNTATIKELEELPTVGPVFAKKIIENRPYKSAGELSRAGLTDKKIAEIAPLVTVEADAAPAAAVVPATPTPAPGPAQPVPAPAPAAPAKPGPAPAPATPTPAPAVAPTPAAAPTPANSGNKIDLNTATVKQLENIPGVTTAEAFRIIANRPYKSADDLSKVGFNAKRIGEEAPHVSFDMPTNPATPSGTAMLATETKALKDAHDKPAKGDVWVNTETGVYHKEGDQWYGKTKVGTYLTEAEAKKDGFEPVK